MQNLINFLALLLFNPFGFTLFLAAVVFAYRNKQYKKSAYYHITRNSYSSVRHDKGKYGEYLTYKFLRHLENGGGKFLFNILIPKGNGDTTEIDVLLICPKGMFVFESKNYSGWIFGHEGNKNWTQTLPKGRGRCHKEHFYNPVMQNEAHVRHLRKLIGQNAPMHSIIVFSDNCTLKEITIKNSDVRVVNHCRLASAVAAISNQIQTNIYTEAEINDIYCKLYPYTQFGHEIKKRHIETIN